MLDRIMYVNETEVRLIFTHRTPVTLYNSSGNILKMLDEFLAPLDSHCETLTEYHRMLAVSQEDTQIIPLNLVS